MSDMREAYAKWYQELHFTAGVGAWEAFQAGAAHAAQLEPPQLREAPLTDKDREDQSERLSGAVRRPTLGDRA